MNTQAYTKNDIRYRTRPSEFNIKITGWSTKHSIDSLVQSVNRCAHLTSHLHYPQLRTAYVILKTVFTVEDVIDYMYRGTGYDGIVIECLRDSGIHESERSLESSRSTVLVQNLSNFNEFSFYKYMNNFGSIRCISFVSSPQTRSFVRKISFYEDQSVDHLLEGSSFVDKTINNHTVIRIERIKDSNKIVSRRKRKETEGKYGQSGAFQSIHKRDFEKNDSKFKVERLLKRELANQKEIGIEKLPIIGISSSKKIRKNQEVRSLSEGNKRSQMQVCVFKDMDQQLETSCSIISSKMNEANSLFIQKCKKGSLRSKSTDLVEKEKKEVVLLSILRRDSSSTKAKFNKLDFTFKLPELSFFHIKSSRIQPNQIKSGASQQHQQEVWARESYMTQDDLSDGYSATEPFKHPKNHPGHKVKQMLIIHSPPSDHLKTVCSSDTNATSENQPKFISPNFLNENPNDIKRIQDLREHQSKFEYPQTRSVNYFYYPDQI